MWKTKLYFDDITVAAGGFRWYHSASRRRRRGWNNGCGRFHHTLLQRQLQHFVIGQSINRGGGGVGRR